MSNTGFLPTNVSALANKINAVLPVYVELGSKAAATIDGTPEISLVPLDGYSPFRVTVGQLSGRLSTRVHWYAAFSFFSFDALMTLCFEFF